jgi:hypothetical protein
MGSSDEDFCWLLGAEYIMTVRPTATGSYFTTMNEVYNATIGDIDIGSGVLFKTLPCGSQAMADARSARLGYRIYTNDMAGYGDTAAGFPSNMQPALAYAVDANAS